MKYSEFIDELRPLLDEAHSLFDEDQTHQSPRFRKWRHQLTTTISIIENLGYTVDCDIASRIFQVASYGSVSKNAQMAAYNRELQDTINEMEIIIEYFDKYGDPKISSQAAASDDRAEKLEWPTKMTLSWLFNHAPIKLWLQFGGILITVFLLGVGFAQTRAYKNIEQLWHHEQPHNKHIDEPNPQLNHDASKSDAPVS
nr:hypothetical protein [uncultured bacterium]BAJ06958.1 hypothetical protein [uncultured bacterium]